MSGAGSAYEEEESIRVTWQQMVGRLFVQLGTVPFPRVWEAFCAIGRNDFPANALGHRR